WPPATPRPERRLHACSPRRFLSCVQRVAKEAAVEKLDVLVIGGGPAGLTAATYLGRLHRRCLVVDAGDSRARWIPESNNCPGFTQGTARTELLERLRAQAESYGAVFEHGLVSWPECDGRGGSS